MSSHTTLPDHPNDWEQFRKHGHELVDFIADYYSSIDKRPVKSQVTPGYLRELLPSSAPEEPEPFDSILRDVEEKIMPGVTHWQGPSFFAYFSANSSWPGLCGEMLSGMFNTIGFSWVASPAASELETIVMDWLGRLVGLPASFLSSSEAGGGVIQGTASEATLVALLAARARGVKWAATGAVEKGDVWQAASELVRAKAAASAASGDERAKEQLALATLGPRFVVYTSDQAHSSVKKAAMIAGLGTSELHFRAMRTRGPDFALDPEELEKAMTHDLAEGRCPLFVCATLGTTGIGACDPLEPLAAVCKRHGVWLHVDAAWAGSALVCEEHRGMLRGVEGADSFDFNPHKWLLVNFDLSAMWVRDRQWLQDALSLTPVYLRSREYDEGLVTDYRDWQIPLGRRFRALKLWMVLRSFGASGLRDHVRRHCLLAERFERLVSGASDRWELVRPRTLGLVCFRAHGSDALNAAVEERVNAGGRTFLVHTELEGRHILRFAVGAPLTGPEHVDGAWEELELALKEVKAAMHETKASEDAE